MVFLTFLIQALVISFHLRLIHRYRGLLMFLISALVLAASSLILLSQQWIHSRPFIALGSSLPLLWGAALQFAALARFTGVRLYHWIFWGLVGGGTVLMVGAVQVVPPPTFVALREILTVIFLLAGVSTLRRADVSAYRFGAWVTAIPLLGYALLSVSRLIRGLFDPSLMQPGPSVNNDIEAVALFAFSLLWTSGFILMVNQRLQSELKVMATRDPLTDCYNRRAMMNKLGEEHSRFLRYGHPYTVILLDLDKFKAINDTLGHGVGDKVLVGLSSTLRAELRTEDSLARWGGEEFLILLAETKEDDGLVLAERLRHHVECHDFFVPGFRVTFSAGVAGAQAEQTVDDLFRRADTALYKAKETRNTVVLAPS